MSTTQPITSGTKAVPSTTTTKTNKQEQKYKADNKIDFTSAPKIKVEYNEKGEVIKITYDDEEYFLDEKGNAHSLDEVI